MSILGQFLKNLPGLVKATFTCLLISSMFLTSLKIQNLCSWYFDVEYPTSGKMQLKGCCPRSRQDQAFSAGSSWLFSFLWRQLTVPQIHLNLCLTWLLLLRKYHHPTSLLSATLYPPRPLLNSACILCLNLTPFLYSVWTFKSVCPNQLVPQKEQQTGKNDAHKLRKMGSLANVATASFELLPLK